MPPKTHSLIVPYAGPPFPLTLLTEQAFTRFTAFELRMDDVTVIRRVIFFENVLRSLTLRRLPEHFDAFASQRLSFAWMTSPLDRIVVDLGCLTGSLTTLDRIVVELRSGVFDHGQLYVALSRVRRPEVVQSTWSYGTSYSRNKQQRGSMYLYRCLRARVSIK